MYVDCLPSVGYGRGGGGEFQVKSTQLLTPMFSFLQYSLHCAQAILLSLSALEYSRAESETMYKLADMVFCLHRRLLYHLCMISLLLFSSGHTHFNALCQGNGFSNLKVLKNIVYSSVKMGKESKQSDYF